MHTHNIGNQTNMCAMVGFVVACVAANVEIAFIEATNEIQAQNIRPLRLFRLSFELPDNVTGDLRR